MILCREKNSRSIAFICIRYRRGRIVLYYLGFALFFLVYFLVGLFTDLLKLTTVGGIIAIAFILLNVYLYVKEKKKDPEE